MQPLAPFSAGSLSPRGFRPASHLAPHLWWSLVCSLPTNGSHCCQRVRMQPLVFGPAIHPSPEEFCP